MIWMWDAVYGVLDGQSTDKTKRKPTKNTFQLVKQEKNTKKHILDITKYFFFKIALDEYSYNTQYQQDCIKKKMFLKTFFLRVFSSAAPTTIYLSTAYECAQTQHSMHNMNVE